MKQTRDKLDQNHLHSDTLNLKSFVSDQGIDLVGIADLKDLKTMPMGLNSRGFVKRYRFAIVMGLPLDRFGPNTSGHAADIYLEKVALEISDFLEKKKYHALTIHTEDEYDPVNRMGLMSLKVLAKAAGLGWQGRSLLVVSPVAGPFHRLIAVMTNMELLPDAPILNQCGSCSLCVDHCPKGALRLVPFHDHPRQREDVLNLSSCAGDQGCTVCLTVCPWQSKNLKNYRRGNEE